MRLSKIKLAGFKSFVDPTTIHLPGNLMGIVGPNGCGKSNIIDAVRWVMGESSAKSLRGESMADVIFNGSTARQPVSQASIELVFDNSAGRVGGQYAQYAEISIKRQVTRDGQSNYFLNGVRCRRRDIVDIFLGTGLGPHSYAIIEQNMISRLIEAKPDELRVLLEEAAGISKYKERRRETENRIKHTRENLDRVNDVREELGKQLERLQRQANMAEKYKVLKERERRLKAELLALRWRALRDEALVQERRIQEQETALEARIAEQRAVEAAIEKQRARQSDVNETFNAVQGEFYGSSADIARLEQAIVHGKERRRGQQQELEQTERAWEELQAHLRSDHQQIAEFSEELQRIEPQWQQAEQAQQASQQALAAAEQAMHAWQMEWESFNERAGLAAQSAHVERTRLEHIEQQLQQLEQRRARLLDEQTTLAAACLEQDIAQLTAQQALHEREGRQLDDALHEVLRGISAAREHQQQLSAQLDARRGELEDRRARLASLEALQQAALGRGQDSVNTWLDTHQLRNAPRLAEQLHVDKGWERAVECALGFHLEAVCVQDLQGIAGALQTLQQGNLSLLDTGALSGASASTAVTTRLQDKVRAPWPLDALFAGIYAADTLPEAMALAARLSVHESVMTRDGVWLGKGWLRVAHGRDEQFGVLGREQELQELRAHVQQLGAQAADLQQRLDAGRAALHDLEQRRESVQAAVNQAQRLYAETQAQLSGKQMRVEEMRARQRAIHAEIEEVIAQQDRARDEQRAAQERLQAALAESGNLERRRMELVQARDEQRAALENLRAAARADHDAAHQIALRIQSLRSALTSAQQRLERMQSQHGQLAARREQLHADITAGEAPLAALQSELEQLLAKRLQIEAELGRARAAVEELEQALRVLEQQRHAAEASAQQSRAELEQSRLHGQEIKVRGEALHEQIREADFTAQALLDELSAEAGEQAWQEQLDQIAQKIQRLGPINLAAIDEFAEQSERKNYLDAQFNDLSEALNTLEDAIRKIDRETRARFKETFDKVNSGLQAMFPRLFGGGHAYLELSGEDLLDTGVTVMARPPGKRNSTIHLLSGGEKALTAVAMVFSIFELNPAPFCMLDEVDASLDEANVGRFCELLKQMSERIQFIYITHNKGSMEVAHHLTGITMSEPGVSRLVAVDVDEAVAMVAAM
ncbi:MAG: chromosome segregation protein SMC [Pseudomonadota bacterium]